MQLVKSMTGVDVKHPLRIAALDASIGRIARLQMSLRRRTGVDDKAAIPSGVTRPTRKFLALHETSHLAGYFSNQYSPSEEE